MLFTSISGESVGFQGPPLLRCLKVEKDSYARHSRSNLFQRSLVWISHVQSLCSSFFDRDRLLTTMHALVFAPMDAVSSVIQGWTETFPTWTHPRTARLPSTPLRQEGGGCEIALLSTLTRLTSIPWVSWRTRTNSICKKWWRTWEAFVRRISDRSQAHARVHVEMSLARNFSGGHGGAG